MEYWRDSLHLVLFTSVTINRLCGFPPFYEENNQKLFDMIKRGEFEFPSPYWDDVSEVAKDLIRQILVVDPKKRLTAEEISQHPWVVGEKTPRTELPKVTNKIKEFNTKRRFKKAAYLVMAANRF